MLVVDDEAGICLAVALLLRDEFRVETAGSMAEALQRLAAPFDLILLDLRLPGVQGCELLDGVRARAGGAPVAVLSATGDLSTREEARRHGAAAFIEKPFSRAELLAQARAALAGAGAGGPG